MKEHKKLQRKTNNDKGSLFLATTDDMISGFWAIGIGTLMLTWCVLRSFALFSTSIIGVTVVVLALVWHRVEMFMSPNQAVLYALSHKASVTGWLLLGWISLNAYPAYKRLLRGAGRKQRRLVARHEAGHALVATVLGIRVHEVRVMAGRVRPGCMEGWSLTGSAPEVHDLGALYTSLVRAAAISVAGAIAEGTGSSFEDIIPTNATNDWAKARQTVWVIDRFRPNTLDLDRIIRAVEQDLDTSVWIIAISQAAEVLLSAQGKAVTGGVIAGIAGSNRLALPAVTSLMHKQASLVAA